MYHIYPVNDEREHDLQTTQCWCEPEVKWHDEETGRIYPEALVVHNAADCRELIKEAEAIKERV